ncbi:hypothetical protein RV00_GL000319 [Enterococcus devriesei]|uniref:Uncharacterized protein n=1 Tax=Enterococcus devriesei TaxID=319970 RepID=A0A1L8SZL9_9ENTE|nr:hypothetical protein RV00_GL000319 [Enterococcus devriesei]
MFFYSGLAAYKRGKGIMAGLFKVSHLRNFLQKGSKGA